MANAARKRIGTLYHRTIVEHQCFQNTCPRLYFSHRVDIGGFVQLTMSETYTERPMKAMRRREICSPRAASGLLGSRTRAWAEAFALDKMAAAASPPAVASASAVWRQVMRQRRRYTSERRRQTALAATSIRTLLAVWKSLGFVAIVVASSIVGQRRERMLWSPTQVYKKVTENSLV